MKEINENPNKKKNEIDEIRELHESHEICEIRDDEIRVISDNSSKMRFSKALGIHKSMSDIHCDYDIDCELYNDCKQDCEEPKPSEGMPTPPQDAGPNMPKSKPPHDEFGDKPTPPSRGCFWIFIIIAAALVFAIVKFCSNDKIDHLISDGEEQVEATEPIEEEMPKEIENPQWIGTQVDSLTQGYTEFRDTIINDIPLRIYIPHNATPELHIGKLNKNDTTIVYISQAADVRADNGGIVGAFVLKGKPLAWGLSKKGYCAAIGDKITIGVADNSPMFEEATTKEGYFFRQYPLVKNGRIVENEPKGKSVRRGLCDRQGEIFIVESLTRESFHDFSQALVDLGVDQAIYLVGSTGYGWAVDKENQTHEIGEEVFTDRRRMHKNTNYILWRRK